MPDQFSDIETKYSQASSAAQDAVNLSGAGANLEKMLRESIADRFTGSPLNAQRETAAQTLLTSPERSRASMAELVKTNPLSPNQQQSIQASQYASDIIPMMTMNDLLGIRSGTINDALGGGINAFNTLLKAQQGKAQLMRES